MKLVLSRTRSLLVAVALIVATNAVVLAGVAYNRSGEPDSTLQLTERELPIRYWSWPENENSSIDVDLRWRIPEIGAFDGNPGMWYGALPWMKTEKLRALGFDVSGDLESDETRERIQRQHSRRAWFVLEHDGAAYREAVANALNRVKLAEARARANAGDKELEMRLKAARDIYTAEELHASRLFVVDSAGEVGELRARYPDRRKYAIVPGSLIITIEGQPDKRWLGARVSKLDIDAIRVPHDFRKLVEPYVELRSYDPRPPRFAATVKFGQRLEPWIAELTLLSNDASTSISR